MKPLLLTLALLQLALSVRAQDYTNGRLNAPVFGAALEPDYGIGPQFGMVHIAVYRMSHFRHDERQPRGRLGGFMILFSDVAQKAHTGLGTELALRDSEPDKSTISWFVKRNVSFSF